VGRVLLFFDAPVVTAQAQWRSFPDPGSYLTSEGMEEGGPFALDQSVENLLGSPQVVDSTKAVVSLPAADPAAGEVAWAPLPAVEADLNRERQPGLQPDMHQAEVWIQVVEVQVQ